MRTPPVNGDRLLTAPVYSSSEFLTLPLAPSLEERENENMLEMKGELSMPPDAYEIGRASCRERAYLTV